MRNELLDNLKADKVPHESLWQEGRAATILTCTNSRGHEFGHGQTKKMEGILKASQTTYYFSTFGMKEKVRESQGPRKGLLFSFELF